MLSEDSSEVYAQNKANSGPNMSNCISWFAKKIVTLLVGMKFIPRQKFF
jgi:hypothetical protein